MPGISGGQFSLGHSFNKSPAQVVAGLVLPHGAHKRISNLAKVLASLSSQHSLPHVPPSSAYVEPTADHFVAATK